LETDDRDLAALNIMQLLRYLWYITAIFFVMLDLKRRKTKIIY
jgi:hypothetical protein